MTMRNRDLSAILRIKSLVEARRQAEQAAASFRVRAADQHRQASESASQQHVVADGATTAAAMALGRAAGVSRQLDVDEAATALRMAQREAQRAEQAWQAVAIERRTIERAVERQQTRAALIAARQAERQLDDLAGQRWLATRTRP